MADIFKHSVLVKDLPTKKVTLYPSSASIERDIEDIALKPGTNEIEIFGLSPTVDENSIQIDGKGAATILDIATELIPNTEIFEEVYPDHEEDSSSDEEDSYGDDRVPEAAHAIEREIEALKAKSARAEEDQNSANQQLVALESYIKGIKAAEHEPKQIKSYFEAYEQERERIWQKHTAAGESIRSLRKEIEQKQKERSKAGKESEKQRREEERQRGKDRRRKLLQEEERRKRARHLKEERLRYWPKKVYKVTVTLETASFETPGSSRRGSIDSVTLNQSVVDDLKPDGQKESDTEVTISLSLSYLTKEAGWDPRYELKVDSTKKCATIIYRTEFRNHTSETWDAAKLSFSTSQTSYQGLDDTVPTIHPWRVKLLKFGQGENSGLMSRAEMINPRNAKSSTSKPFNRSEFFGNDTQYVPPAFKSLFAQTQQAHQRGPAPTKWQYITQQQAIPQQRMQQQQQVMPQAAQAFGQAPLFGGVSHARTSGGLFGNSGASQAAPPPPPPGHASFGSQPRAEEVVEHVEQAAELSAPAIQRNQLAAVLERGERLDALGSDPITTPETTWEDSGLTATYEVPGARSLTPSSTTRRHKIATLTASNIQLSHVAVPKLRPAAFLRAKITNPSSAVTLLRGSMGITLDGAFLGNTILPRVEPAERFELSLGVDPGIQISYPKPTMKRSTQGIIFNKESAQIFTRSVYVNNRKTTPVEVRVLDQVPVSEDERLRIEVLVPRGLGRESEAVRAGVNAKGEKRGNGGKDDGKWGSARAELKKNGEVVWDVRVEKGMGALLQLEYEARLPPSEAIVEA
ncbi:hypothetical protein H2203_009239 [Taxawa tesnikishii (nom. ined.)]|nr:hypothetical protein H2203_009239 [Dothideales sp. JES 119]